MKALILYHSYTSNTANVASFLENRLIQNGCRVLSLSLHEAVRDIPMKDPDLVILGTPVFYWTVPQAAMRLIKQLPDFSGAKAFVFGTYGGCLHKDILHELALELHAHGASTVGGALLLAPHSCPDKTGRRVGDINPDHGMGKPDEETMQTLLDNLLRIVEHIKSNQPHAFTTDDLRFHNVRPFMRFFGLTSYRTKLRFMPPVKIDHAKCVGCKACLKACETGSISFSTKGKLHINKNTCSVCYDCIPRCKAGALELNWKWADAILWLMERARSNTASTILS